MLSWALNPDSISPLARDYRRRFSLPIVFRDSQIRVEAKKPPTKFGLQQQQRGFHERASGARARDWSSHMVYPHRRASAIRDRINRDLQLQKGGSIDRNEWLLGLLERVRRWREPQDSSQMHPRIPRGVHRHVARIAHQLPSLPRADTRRRREYSAELERDWNGRNQNEWPERWTGDDWSRDGACEEVCFTGFILCCWRGEAFFEQEIDVVEPIDPSLNGWESYDCVQKMRIRRRWGCVWLHRITMDLVQGLIFFYFLW